MVNTGRVGSSQMLGDSLINDVDKTLGSTIIVHSNTCFSDMIALPDFNSGAMENWGIITYRETALLYKEGVSSETNKQRIALVVAHELAHMVR